MKRLANKVAVVTGGNSGIGLATAKLFAEHGAKVAITGRDKASIEKAIALVSNDSIGIVSDVADLKNIDAQYKQVKEKFGNIDVLVVNAGIYVAGPTVDFTEEMFDKVSNVNFKGAFFSIQRALPYLNDGASIIITGSAAGAKGFATLAAYGATKAAVRSLARSFSSELLDRKIRVNVLSPGPIDTPIFDRTGMSKEEVDGTKAHFASGTPVKRLGSSEEIADGFLYLASDDSRFFVGGELVLDGGVSTL